MKPKKKAASKIPTTQTNTNRKKTSQVEAEASVSDSFLNKNEYAMILLGALCLTLVVYFVFFSSPSKKSETVENTKSSPSYAQLEKRIQVLEDELNKLKQASTPGGKNNSELLKNRISRLETAFSVKFESLTDKVARVERNISSVKSKTKVPVKTSSVSKKSVKKTALPVKKASSSSKKAPMFHTVKKGDTFYSISKQHNISVNQLLKLNKLTSKDKIYPGTNLLIR